MFGFVKKIYMFLLCKKKLHRHNYSDNLKLFLLNENYMYIIRQSCIQNGIIPTDADMNQTKQLITQLCNDQTFNAHLNELIETIMKHVQQIMKQ